MLLLRALLGIRLILQGIAYFNTPEKGLLVWTITVSTFALGILLLGGLMTPFAALIVALGGLALSLSVIPVPSRDLLSGNLSAINLIVLALALAALGPGAFSLDSRMFGRREIAIPPSSDKR